MTQQNKILSVVMLALIGLAVQFFSINSWAKQGEVAAEKLVAAMPNEFPPYYMLDKQGRPSGFAIDVMDGVAKLMEVEVVYQIEDSWAAAQDAVDSGSADLLPNMGITKDRLRRFNFTQPVETFSIGLFVREATHDIEGINDLSGKRVAVVERNVGVRLLQKYDELHAVVYSSQEKALFALLSGEVDGFVYPAPVTWMMAQAADVDHHIQQVGPPLLEIKRGISVHKNNQALLDNLNQAVSEFVVSPEYQRIYAHWFAKPTPYWTVDRIVTIGGATALSLFILMIIGMIYWRYRTTLSLNIDLEQTIKQRDQVQQALQQLNSELESRVEQSTHDLYEVNHQLLQAQRIVKLGYWRFDCALEKLFWSDEVYSIFELDVATFDPSYESFVDAIHPDDQSRVKQAFEAHLEDKQPYEIEHRLLMKDGRVKYVLEQCETDYDESGKPLFSLGTVLDITERVNMERLILQTEKMISVGGLAAGMAHELNSPLGGILQSVQNIQRRISPEYEKNQQVARALNLDLNLALEYWQQRGIINFVQNISDSGEQAAEIVRNLLKFSRAEKVSLLAERVEGLIDSSLKLVQIDYDLKKRYDFKTIEIQRDFQTDLPAVYCLAGDLQQVLLNLLRNAAQALFEQHDSDKAKRISVSAYQREDWVYITVEDNGPGMDEETCRRVFEPFFTTRDPGEGSGLGLAVSYYIVHGEHGGNLDVESELGKGTKFTIKLPISPSL